ncbi:unnamed protein product [Effrenium voratum]|nr:unnamed protein product [Effrenium voratum]
MVARAFQLYLLLTAVFAAVVDFEEAGAKADDSAEEVEWKNGALLNQSLAALRPGDVLQVPGKTFYLMGGIQAHNLAHVVIRIDGTLKFSDKKKAWPRIGGKVLPCMRFQNVSNVTFTSQQRGTLDGQGVAWWGYLRYLENEENRPRLWEMDVVKDVLVEKLLLTNSPYWTTWFTQVDGLEIRDADILNRRNGRRGHDLWNLGAFNTDGWDLQGTNVWVHHSKVWNQDDCFTVKGSSSNMLFENIEASGLGLTIGSQGGKDVVTNITFRNVYMDRTYKGIYMKFRDVDKDEVSIIQNITYENIYMKEPEQWAIWIGPAQQSDSRYFWEGHPCSLLWPSMPGAQCHPSERGIYRNILLRNITIDNPKMQPGVIWAGKSFPMKNLTFDSVRVVNWHKRKADLRYRVCDGVDSASALAIGDTSPTPACFRSNGSELLV